MSEAMILIPESRLAMLEHKLDQLLNLTTRQKVKDRDIWIDEAEAAALMGYKDLRTFREKCKSGSFDIAWRVRPGAKHKETQHASTGNRGYQYKRKDIERYKESTSTM